MSVTAQRGKSAAVWLAAPFWALQVFTGAKTFGANPILASAKLNRRGLHAWRTRLAHRMADRRRARLRHLLTADELAAFKANGYLVKPDFLPADDFAALVDEIGRYRGEILEFIEGRAVTRRVPLGFAATRRLPQCRRLTGSVAWHRLLRFVAGCNTPAGVFVQEIVTRAESPEIDPQTRLHMDTFHPTAKAWLFLNDVAEDQGPLTYVPGSHRPTTRRLAWQRRRSVAISLGPTAGGAFRIEEGELKRLRLPPPVRFAVPANTLIVADTYGFHARGEGVGSSRRLEIYAISRDSPFTPFLGLTLNATGQQQLRGSAFMAYHKLRRRFGLAGRIRITPDSHFGEESPTPIR
jgi:hypothetical protein